MLTQSGVLSEDDLSAIRQGMAEIIAEIKEGTISWSLDLEDVHMNIERRLTDKIGDAGKRLHTGRSRNDQVATDIRLWLRDQITVIQDLIRSLQTALVDLAEQNAETVMPGFTHLQAAQPVSFGHHARLCRNARPRFRGWPTAQTRYQAVGAAALPVPPHPIQREITAGLLGFEQICQNSLDAVSDRDFFAIEFTAAASLIMVHLSRLSEELILWMSRVLALLILPTVSAPARPSCRKETRRTRTRAVKSGRVIGHLIGLDYPDESQPWHTTKTIRKTKSLI